MFNYISRGGPNDDVMVASRFPDGYILVDRAGTKLGDGEPWMWTYERKEVHVDTDEQDEDGNPVREMRGYYFVCADETGEPFNEEQVAQAAEGSEYDVLAWDSGVVAGDVVVGL